MIYKRNIVACLVLLLMMFTLQSCGSTKKIAGKKQTSYTLSAGEERRFTYFFYEALKQRELGNYDVAIELLTKCYHINDLDATLMSEFANVYLSVGKVDYAVSYLTNAVALDENNSWYQLNLANLYLAIGDIKTATEIFEFSSKKFPEKEELNHYLVELYMRQQRYNDAINALNTIEKKQGISEDTSFEKWRIYYNLGEGKKAMKELDVLIAKFPREMKYHILKGNVYFENEEFDRALAEYNYVLEQEPDNGFLRLSLTEYYQKTGEHEKALAETNYALRSKNIDVETKIGILDGYLSMLKEQDKWGEETISLFETLLEIHPNVIEIHHYYASHLFALEKFDAAEKEFETILDIDPQSVEAYVGIIQLKINQKKPEDLVEITNKAIEALPDAPGWYLYQGIAHFQLKQYDDAIAAYQKGLSLVADADGTLKSDFYGQLGDIYFEKKDKKSAFESYENALKFNPMNTHVLNNYSYYLAEEKQDLLKAEEMIKRCLKLSPQNSHALDTYAWVLFQQGYYNLAKRYIEEAIKHSEEPSDIIIEHYGDILYMIGDKAEALEAWKQSQELGNESKTLLQKIKEEKYIEDEKK